MTRTRPRSSLGARVRWLAATFTLLALAGCGGDGGNGGGGGNEPTVTLTASPTTINLGESTTLTWSSNSGTSCTASGDWSGSKSNSGTESVTPAAAGTATYTISCSGGIYSGSGTATATVTVNEASATAFTKTVLVADTDGVGAQTTDPNLVNPWGIALGPESPVWVANAHSDTSTVYDGNGRPQPSATPLVVQLEEPAAGVEFEPTGLVFNATTDFVVSSGANSAPALFIFAGEGGAIAGWAASVDLGNAVTVYVDTEGASYTGLTLANNGTANFLYAADFANAKVDVFDASFEKQTPSATSFGFEDSTLPEGYAPFGIQALPTGTDGAMQIYVAYARNDAGEEEVGEGLGVVNVFDTNGTFVKRLVEEGGVLNAPWGMAFAPSDYGTFSGTVLIGNFGDGKINAFDVATGEHVGTISDADGEPFAVPGLWGIAFGNDHNNQPPTTLFYAAGTNGEVNGEFGRIDMGSEPPVLDEPPEVTLTAPAAGNVSGTVTVSAEVTSSVEIERVEFFAGTTSLGTVTTAPYSVTWDTTQVDDGAVALTAQATDVNGNTGTSPAVNVTVANAGPPAVTLSQLQTEVFTPHCTSCHNGSGSSLPGSMDLRNGQAHASLVNVASVEKPSLMRVAPGDSANSYLIHKLEGGPDIVGSRMPLTGGFLDQATIDMVKAWIDAGAAND
jgi:uncharacterized protein (TIGR03118 family)